MKIEIEIEDWSETKIHDQIVRYRKVIGKCNGVKLDNSTVSTDSEIATTSYVITATKTREIVGSICEEFINMFDLNSFEAKLKAMKDKGIVRYRDSLERQIATIKENLGTE